MEDELASGDLREQARSVHPWRMKRYRDREGCLGRAAPIECARARFLAPSRAHRRAVWTFAIASLFVLWSREADATPSARFGDHHYELDVRLDTEARSIRGLLRIEYTNRSEASLHDLLFHLYPNAFRDESTVFMRESGGALRGVEAEGGGKITLHSLRVGGVERLDAAEDELIPQDRTQLRLPLEEPLHAGERLEVEIEFTTELPKLFARSGYIDDFYVGAQFFPKLAKLTPQGEWVSFPYHGLGEFYADFASYHLRLSAPHSMIVAANGVRGQDEVIGSRRIHSFIAEDMHDLVFVASNDLELKTTRCHGIRVHLFFPKGAEQVADESEALSCFGLGYLGDLLFPYPYKDLSIVIPIRRASGGAGMEYPGLFLTNAGALPPPGFRFFGHEATTAHELSHQYFQGVIASDEVNHPLLDEGLASFFTYELLRAAYGRQRSGLEWPAIDAYELLRLYQDERPSPATRPAFLYKDGVELYQAIYARVPLLLETLARTYGREQLLKTLAGYARRHRFGHPTPEDLYRAFEEGYSKDFLRLVVKPALQKGSGARFRLEAVHDPASEDALGRSEKDRRFKAIREGSLPIPTMIAAFYEDGRVLSVPFPEDVSELELRFEREGLVRVEIDPERRNLLDRRRGDQRMLYNPRPSPRLEKLLRALFALIAL